MSDASKPLSLWGRRKLKKLKKHLLHEAHHARYFREDIAQLQLINRVKDAEVELEKAWQGGRGDPEVIDQCMDELHEASKALLPPGKSPKARENVEVALVAIGIALAFRTYFIQPFKIPTGSMQPSLYGITHAPKAHKEVMDFFPLNLVKLLATGERYIEKKAPADGQLMVRGVSSTGEIQVQIANKVIKFPKDLQLFFDHGDFVTRGQVLASGVRKSGDQILVDKVRYNFMRPKRGQVVVFNTNGIKHPQIKVDQFYIKRLVGLPQEEVSIVNRKLTVDGKTVSRPPLFSSREYNLVDDYRAVPLPKFKTESDTYYLGSEDYLMFGDNTYSSLDGRYFGGVKESKLLGPAFAVHWPFWKRMGSIKSVPVRPPS